MSKDQDKFFFYDEHMGKMYFTLLAVDEEYLYGELSTGQRVKCSKSFLHTRLFHVSEDPDMKTKKRKEDGLRKTVIEPENVYIPDGNYIYDPTSHRYSTYKTDKKRRKDESGYSSASGYWVLDDSKRIKKK